MKYLKAQEVLPEKLLKEVQKYLSGDLLYIPKPKNKHLKWGEVSGYKEKISYRNKSIKAKYNSGESIENLAKKYYLSNISIKKIIYD